MSAQTPLLDRVASPRDLRQFPEEDLRRIADELRAATVDAVSCTGGHLGAGLGAVELTVALHYVFDTPNDRIVWDVGHQAYPHKILTGRRDRIRTLRQAEGLSGFTKRAESEYDPFGAAHSSTSVSAAFGMAVAHDLKGEGRRAIAVIGDGALSAGMAYEALNNAGAAGHRPLVILNDNNMSIAPSLGAITNYLLDLVPRTDDHRMGEAKRLLAERFPEVLERARQYTCKPCRSPLGADTVFEKLGFEYLGPIDGHAMDQLVPMLTLIRDAEASGPVLLHIITEKGHGYGPAETSADKYHGISKFEVPTGTLQKGKAKAPSYTAVYAQSLIKEAEKDPRIVAITAAMPSGTGVDKFAQRFPDRAFDVGIAEQHGITFAAGLATEGMKPFATIYSTFLQRAYDQIVHDVAIQGLPVRFAMDRAGLVGADGATHAGAYDIAYLGCLPGFVLMAAADEAELVHMVATAAAHDGGPIAFRYPRGEGVGAPLPDAGQPLEIGRGRIVREGTAVALLSFGSRLQECLGAADDLADRGFSTTVADARFAKPIDVDLVHRLAREHEALILVEEGSTGGFATQVFHCLAQDGILDQGLKVRSLVLPDRFIDQGAPEQMYEWAGLKAPDIVSAALGVLQATGKPRLAAARAIR